MLICVGQCKANDGDPLAVRYWPEGLVTIETHWNLVCRLNTTAEAELLEMPAANLVLSLNDESFSGNGRIKVAGQQMESQDLAISQLDHFLDRAANETEVRWVESGEATYVSPNAVHVSTLQDQFIVLSVDGVRLLLVAKQQASELRDLDSLNRLTGKEAVDAILDLSGDSAVADLATLLDIPRIIRPAPDKATGNTLAISSRAAQTDATAQAVAENDNQPALIGLGTKPWALPEELRGLFKDKEQACRDSQEVFAKLSANELNFKPSNGTHTPRWNAEHMMGRELLFFSQIYSAVEPSIGVFNLNPKQMPKDYKAAHADWSGQEEARQMERVSAFTRRFAYLLEGMELDNKPKGSFWTLRGLLKQMQRHYGEHTANVVKKFELEDWPRE